MRDTVRALIHNGRLVTCALLIISDGRDEYHEKSLISAADCLPEFEQTIHIEDRGHRLGFAGAIQKGWSQVRTDYVFHLEADFTFNRPVPVDDMISVLEARPYLVQMALLRQPWNERERAAGGIVQMDPELYSPASWNGYRWLEHRRNVTTNPCVWPRRVIDRGWPQVKHSEGHFGIDLFASDPALRAAYWGAGEEWVTHIGDVRSGRGY